MPPFVINRRAAAPIHRQVFEWFQSAIVEGRLRPGERVPSSRDLAMQLRVSRIPVVNAYEQLLAEGYFETFTGVGTRVARSIPQEGVPRESERTPNRGRQSCPSPAPRKFSQRGKSWSKPQSEPWLDNAGAFRVSLPALDHFPVDIWSRLMSKQSKGVSRNMLAYGDAKGHEPLREEIADYVRTARGVRCDVSQILITTGSQQALQIASQVLLDPKDRVCVEEPGYPGALHAFAMADSDIVPISVDEDGMLISELVRKGRRAKVVYLTPSHQYPLGSTLSTARRQHLLTWAAYNGTWIIEDDYDGEYRFDGSPVTSLQGLDCDERVLYMGTFSKVMFPALRMGYLVLPKDLVTACTAARDCMDIFSPSLNQAVMADFMREGHFARHLRRMRMLYLERRKVLVSALEEAFGESVEIPGAEAGMHLVMLLEGCVDDVAIATDAARAGISAMPLSSCCVAPGGRKGLVLGYAGVSVPSIRAGVKKLKASIDRVATPIASRSQAFSTGLAPIMR